MLDLTAMKISINVATDFHCRIKVMDDQSYQKDRMLGWVCWRLDRLPQGLMLVELRGHDSNLTGGKLLIEIRATSTRAA